MLALVATVVGIAALSADAMETDEYGNIDLDGDFDRDVTARAGEVEDGKVAAPEVAPGGLGAISGPESYRSWAAEDAQASSKASARRQANAELEFRAVDANGDDMIDEGELADALRQIAGLDCDLIPAIAREITALGDRDHDGKLDIGEFLELESGQDSSIPALVSQASGLGCYDCSCCCECAWWAGCLRGLLGIIRCSCCYGTSRSPRVATSHVAKPRTADSNAPSRMRG